jgi:hypothetical protein
MHENSSLWRLRLVAGRRTLTALAAAAACSAVGLAAAPAAHAADVTLSTLPPGNTGLSSVAAISKNDAWAVGAAGTQIGGGGTAYALMLHWNGTKWTKTALTAGGTIGSNLASVNGDSASDVWAVGSYVSKSPDHKTLILHYNGTKWTQAASPNPSSSNGQIYLQSVSAVSPTDAWAAGYYQTDATNAIDKILLLHWNGTTWSQATSPDPGTTHGTLLSSVVTLSSTDAWADGQYSTGSVIKTLVMHWNGKTWAQVSSPSLGGATDNTVLNAIGADSATDIWGVGWYITNGADAMMSLHSNGSTWSQVSTPGLAGGGTELNGVDPISPTNAWAVGNAAPAGSGEETVALHWNGTKWARVTTPNPGGTIEGYGLNALTSMSSVSASDAWAVGGWTKAPDPDQTLILHWNGSTWTKVTSPN